MANYNQIFVETKLSLDDFATELSRITGCPLRREVDIEYPEDVGYSFISDKIAGGLDSNIFGDDEDLPLARYNYEISARSLRLGDVSPAETTRWRDEFLQQVYDSLKSTGLFPIAFVRGHALFIERYDPQNNSENQNHMA